MVAPEEQRRFAVEVVRRLRAAGFAAYWAGGCVRDRLLGIAPKDFDVATSATPDQIRELFGRRRTLAIGAAFGVITVRGPREAGQVEVATFRRDAEYSDGRHPDHVTFSSPEEDAARRDFTVNGLFYDPVEERVIDFVGGQEDLQRRLLRAIGRPDQRFAEDKLRMLRAVRFAARFELAIERETLDAVRRMAGQITVVSPERIAMEMRAILVDRHRAVALRMLVETHLAEPVLPEIVPRGPADEERLTAALVAIERLREPGFPLALGTLLALTANLAATEEVGRRWKLSNKESERTAWLVEHRDALHDAAVRRWSELQPIVTHEGIEDLVAMEETIRPGSPDAAWCRAKLQEPLASLDPPPLVTGDDLRERRVPAGPIYRTLLEQVRRAQLDTEIQSRADALAMIDRTLRPN